MSKFSINGGYNNDFGGLDVTVSSTIDKSRNTAKGNVVLKLVTGVIIGFINGFWGGGGGMVCVPLLTRVVGLPDKKAHATTLLIMLPLSVASLIVYLLYGNLMWIESVKVGIGFIVGGYLGALILKKISNTWLCAIFSLVIIWGGIKLLI